MSGIIRNIILLVACNAASIGFAQTTDPAFGGDFTFRMVKPPADGAKKRITIQVESPEIADKAKTPTPQIAQAIDENAWFWDVIDPTLDKAIRGRFLKAVDQVAKTPEGAAVAAPRFEILQQIVEKHGTDILILTHDKRISPALVLAIIAVESGGRVSAKSDKGAVGLMQVIPDTAKRFGLSDPADASQNIKAGVAYMDFLMGKFHGDAVIALAGYNAGENAVIKYNGVPPFDETRAYVPKVLAAWRVARAMCVTPPQLPTDGCVFRVKG